MPYRYCIYEQHGVGIISLEGLVTDKEITQAMAAFYQDEAWRKKWSVVWDGRSIRQLLFELEGIEHIAVLTHQLRKRIGIGKAAVLVRRDMDYDIARLLIVKTRDIGRQVEIFKSVSEAARWLGVPTLPEILS